MKTKILQTYLIAFFLVTDFIAFAQPGSGGDVAPIEDNDPPPTPINGKLVWL